MKFLVNLLLGILAFAIARYALALIGLDEAIGWVLSVIIGIFVFAQNFASRMIK